MTSTKLATAAEPSNALELRKRKNLDLGKNFLAHPPTFRARAQFMYSCSSSTSTFMKRALMDYSLLTVAATSISVAKELGKTAIGLRDFNEVAATISKLNEQLLKAQDALFAHNVNLHQLQQQQIETSKKLRELEELLAERGRYSLFEISQGVFVYRLNAVENIGEDGQKLGVQPVHYVCQPCFDKRIKAVLIRSEGPSAVSHKCPECNTNFLESKKEWQPLPISRKIERI